MNASPTLPRPTARTAPWFVADWRPTVFVHHAVPPETLAPHVPFELDLCDGAAWVSLVFFQLERMKLAGVGPLGRWLARPISDHPFLNFRTYVRGPAGPGIHFLAEWIPNRVSLPLGPRIYGLPYRYGRFSTQFADDARTAAVHIDRARTGGVVDLEVSAAGGPWQDAAPGSRDEFLLERYVAYTHHAGVARCFEVRHAPWRWRPAASLRCDAGLVRQAFPWFEQAVGAGAHLSPGVTDVQMGRPVRLPAASALPASPRERTSAQAPIDTKP